MAPTDMTRSWWRRRSIASRSGAPTDARAPPGMCLDKGYDYDNTRELVREFGSRRGSARGEEAQAIKREAGYRARTLGRGTDT